MTFDPPKTAPTIQEGASGAKVIILIGIIFIAIAGTGSYFLRNISVGSLSDYVSSAQLVNVEKAEVTPVPQQGKVVGASPVPPKVAERKGKLGLELVRQPNAVTIYFGESKIRDIPVSNDSRNWVGVIHDPYKPLVNLGGTPFFDGKNMGVKPSDNIVRLLDNDGQLIKDPNLFKPFPFFSEASTTIGFIEGFYDRATFESHVTLTFLNTDNGQSLVIQYDRLDFPEWFKKGGYPPAFAKLKYIYLVNRSNWYGENIYDTVQRFNIDHYEEASNVLTALYKRELHQAQLLPKDFQILKDGDVFSNSFNTQLYESIKRLTKLCYYAKKLGQSEVTRALLPQLHPSIQKAINSNKELAP